MKGVYTLIIEMPKTTAVNVGAKRKDVFEQGFWVYVGSALGTTATNLANRLSRHFRSDKKSHWHIDYLLRENVTLLDAIWSTSERNRECEVVSQLLASGQFEYGPKGFGSSDCKKGCTSHIVMHQLGESPLKIVRNTFIAMGLEPILYSQTKPNDFDITQ